MSRKIKVDKFVWTQIKLRQSEGIPATRTAEAFSLAYNTVIKVYRSSNLGEYRQMVRDAGDKYRKPRVTKRLSKPIPVFTENRAVTVVRLGLVIGNKFIGFKIERI